MSEKRNMKTAEVIMTNLGYTREWMTLCIIDNEFLCEQYEDYMSSDDKNQEHYRYCAFDRWLDSKDSLTDLELDQILKLRDNGPDQCDMSVHRVVSLIITGILSDQQMDSLILRPEAADMTVLKLHNRHTLFRRLNREGLSEKVFDLVKKTQDAMIHKEIASRNDLAAEHVMWLKEYGLTKAVRNICKQKANSRT